jgi:DNA repair exonuclease SbcCD ATPase subunit
MPDTVDIKKVISTSTSSVSIDDLSKKGFKQVKVLNQAVITRLIGEAVDRVLEAKAKEITKEEREKVITEARSHFETLARERLEKERSRIEELRHSNQDLSSELETVRKRLNASIEVQAERDQAMGRLQALENESNRVKTELSEFQELFAKKKVEVIGLQAELQSKAAEVDRLKAQLASRDAEPKSDALVEKILTAVNQKLQTSAQPAEVQKIMLSLDTLSRRLSNMGSGGGGGGADMGDPETLKDFVLESLFDKEKGAGVETNVTKVKVKQSKAGDVKGALAKLKKMQKGGEDG